ncbi:MAG: ABC transporter substrate-binding protein [Pseudomonadota bacterium]
MIKLTARRARSFAAALLAAPIGLATWPVTAQPIEAFAASAEVAAEVDAAPSEFVMTLVDDFKTLATSSSDGEEARNEGFRNVLSEDMALSRMKAFLLSREQRGNASEGDLDSYEALFDDYITAAYASEIDELVSRTIEVNDVVVRRPGDFIVRSKLYNDDGEERAGIDWRVLDVSGDLRLVDVMVDGLSFNVERRAQFTSIIQNDGFDALISHMENQIAGNVGSAE